jgi:hypothetical protein
VDEGWLRKEGRSYVINVGEDELSKYREWQETVTLYLLSDCFILVLDRVRKLGVGILGKKEIKLYDKIN